MKKRGEEKEEEEEEDRISFCEDQFLSLCGRLQTNNKEEKESLLFFPLFFLFKREFFASAQSHE